MSRPTPTWDDLTPGERAGVTATLILFPIGILVTPYLLTWAAGRTPAIGVGRHVLDAVVIEIVGSIALVLWPLKRIVKDWIHAPVDTVGAKVLRYTLAMVLASSGLLLASLVLPQIFFLLTNRGAAADLPAWLHDGGAFLFAISGQILALIPYGIAATHLSRRL